MVYFVPPLFETGFVDEPGLEAEEVPDPYDPDEAFLVAVVVVLEVDSLPLGVGFLAGFGLVTPYEFEPPDFVLGFFVVLVAVVFGLATLFE